MTTRWAIVLLMFVLMPGCGTTSTATRYDLSGWFSVKLGESNGSYVDRLKPLPMSLSSPPCEELRETSTHKRVYVLVPGFVGDNAEWKDVVKILGDDGNAFIMRYLFLDSRDDITARLAAGVTRMLRCLPDSQLVIIAHSSGGVLASIAAAGFANAEGKDGPRVLLVTVAAELAGTVNREPPPDGQQQRNFALDIGAKIDGYPQPAPGVRVVHLVTTAAADPHMEPNDGHLPNDPRVHVPGAHEVVIPGLNHADSLVYAARQLAGDDWKKWLDASTAR